MIDDHIPVPKTRKRPGKPWEDLVPGQSFFVPGVSDVTTRTGPKSIKLNADGWRKLRARLQAKAHACWGTGNYALRTTEQDGVKGFRVWRKA